jgi:hypothetical protein
MAPAAPISTGTEAIRFWSVCRFDVSSGRHQNLPQLNQWVRSMAVRRVKSDASMVSYGPQ